MTVTVGSLFAGIGGLDLGLERAGMECVWQVENDPYARQVLEKHWPDVRRWDDVRTFPPRSYEFSYSWRGHPEGAFAPDAKRETTRDEWGVDLICGGFPCQDISYAGRGAGLAGERSGLFFEALRVVRQLRPRIVLLENVAALLTRGLDIVLGSLGEIGYDAEWHCIPAASVGAPHIRDRVFIIAYSNTTKQYGPLSDTEAHERGWMGSDISNTLRPECKSGAGGRGIREDDTELADALQSDGFDGRQRGRSESAESREEESDSHHWSTEPDVGRVANGIPRKLVGLDIDEGYMLLLTYAHQTISDPREVLRTLRSATGPSEIQKRKTGSSNNVFSPQVLQLYLRQLQERCDQELLPQKGQEVQENILRVLRSLEESTGSPCESGLPQQQPREHPDSLQALSRLLAQSCRSAWTPYRGTYAADRTDRLRCLGNAVVPQVAEWIGRRIMESQ